jgi:hypothetical protein
MAIGRSEIKAGKAGLLSSDGLQKIKLKRGEEYMLVVS